MRIISATVTNFASYKHLDFTFDEQGLCLVAGATGSGKSTLCDVIPWILFGLTAKGGAVDEVISWNAEGPTRGLIDITLNGSEIRIVRTRGNKNNDLYFHVDNGEERRGKDLNDTQKLINSLLGLSAELYLSGAYFHEFSQAASFFTTTAKNRRQVTEQIVDLSLAKTLNEKAAAYKKELKEEINTIKNDLSSKISSLKFLDETLEDAKLDRIKWGAAQQDKIAKAQRMSEAFESNLADDLETMEEEFDNEATNLRSTIILQEELVKPDSYFTEKKAIIERGLNEATDKVCPTCGTAKNNTNKLMLTKESYSLQNELNSNHATLTAIATTQRLLDKHLDPNGKARKAIEERSKAVNTYAEQIIALKSEENPYRKIVQSTEKQMETTGDQVLSLQTDLDSFHVEQSDLELLVEVIDSFRAELVKSAIVDLENNTNLLLNKHFDAEIRVAFDIADSDKLDVTITKDGNIASYTQLSKGQRTLLKLCFGISVMKCVSNHHGLNFNSIFFDESLDGLSDEFKIKSYGLFNQLSTEYESVFIVEHSQELKTMFNKRYEVTLEGGASTIEEA